MQNVSSESIDGDRISSLDGRAVAQSGTMSTVRARYYLRRHVCVGRGAARRRERQVLVSRDGSL